MATFANRSPPSTLGWVAMASTRGSLTVASGYLCLDVGDTGRDAKFTAADFREFGDAVIKFSFVEFAKQMRRRVRPKAGFSIRLTSFLRRPLLTRRCSSASALASASGRRPSPSSGAPTALTPSRARRFSAPLYVSCSMMTVSPPASSRPLTRPIACSEPEVMRMSSGAQVMLADDCSLLTRKLRSGR
jgi:hypothetical protein